jgi:hypothetical protein
MSGAILHCNPDRHENVRVGEDLEALLAELERHAAAAVRADKVAEDHRQAIRELLPEARKKGAGPAELARTIKNIYAAGTISRWTAEPGAPRGRKKKPAGRSPDES